MFPWCLDQPALPAGEGDSGHGARVQRGPRAPIDDSSQWEKKQKYGSASQREKAQNGDDASQREKAQSDGGASQREKAQSDGGASQCKKVQRDEESVNANVQGGRHSNCACPGCQSCQQSAFVSSGLSAPGGRRGQRRGQR